MRQTLHRFLYIPFLFVVCAASADTSNDAAPDTNSAIAVNPPLRADTTQPPKQDSAANPEADSARARAPDTNNAVATNPPAAKDSINGDNGGPPEITWPWTRQNNGTLCRPYFAAAHQCTREDERVFVQSAHLPGFKVGVLSAGDMRSLNFKSSFTENTGFSPYGWAGLLPPRAYLKSRGDIEGVGFLPAELDSPLTRLYWERGALELNVFHLKAARRLSPRTYLTMEIMSERLDSLDYGYAFQVHQPYLGLGKSFGSAMPFLKRDSASLVIGGTSPEARNIHLRPRLGYAFHEKAVLEVYFDGIKNTSQIASPQDGDSVRVFYDEPIQVSLPAEWVSSGFGGGLWVSSRGWDNAVEYGYSSQRRRLSGFLPGDSSLASQSHREKSHRLKFSSRLSEVWGKPSMEAGLIGREVEGGLVLGETPAFSDTSLPEARRWKDEEYIGLGVKDSLFAAAMEGEGQWRRVSTLDDRRLWLASGEGRVSVRLPAGITAEGGSGYREEYLPWHHRFVMNSVVYRFPNPDVEKEKILFAEGKLGGRWQYFRLSYGLRSTYIRDVVLPVTLPYRGLPAAGDSAALGQMNYEGENRLVGLLGVGASLGNWSVFVQVVNLLSNRITGEAIEDQPEDYNPLLPKVMTQGRLEWGNRFVQDRLGVGVRWDWEWFADRRAWAPGLNGSSEAVTLQEFLALDFTAEMNIKTFTLYYQIANMNHDRYTLDPGAHPPGVNFRWGVYWVLKG